MRYLQVTGIDGADLQLVDEDGEQFALTVTDQVRSSVDSLRGDDRADVGSRPSLRTVDTESATVHAVPSTPPLSDIPALPPGELVTPRTVQELLRAGHSAPQVAAAADWELARSNGMPHRSRPSVPTSPGWSRTCRWVPHPASRPAQSATVSKRACRTAG